MAPWRVRRLVPLLTFVTLGMILGSLLQLALLRRLDDHSHAVHVDNDPEVAVLRLGYAIEKRISVFSQIPKENGELIQVLRYEPSQYYRPHHDYFSDTAGEGECSCGGKVVKGLCVKPNKGDAVLFWSMGLDGNTDPNSIHSGCPVLKGEKWSATKWMRQKLTF
ncbi:hypothetical protein PR202_gb25861 [Eleusine coracana subsp. coracana]|uniref:Fe2OG dioxygenase domain-containing protein n=1 Tax=Eleusine coracana subsp. coracana TaxID=191504 RepID=A0AAV5FMK7_ELECO|nr:hypothetical protein PR202_gb25861 [Eleusine coracana subsp. coracana]